MINPPPGTFVFQELSPTKERSSFNLVAHKAKQGTAKVTEYIIAYDNEENHITEDAIAQITLEQCYNYPNFSGAIKIPACLFSAARLSKLVGENIHDFPSKAINDKSLKNRPFYL